MKEEEEFARGLGAFQVEDEHVKGGSRTSLSATMKGASTLERAWAEG